MLEGRLPFGLKVVHQRVGHEQSERRRQVAAHHLVVVDEDAFKDSLVQVSTDARPCLGIQLLSLGQQSTDVGHPSVQGLPVAVKVGQASLYPCPSERDPFLLLLDRVQVQSAGRDGFHEALLPLLQLRELSSTFGQGGVSGGENLVEVFGRQGADLGNSSFRQGDSRPVSEDQILNNVGLSGAETTAILERLPAEAVEVVIELALPIAALFKAQRFAAAAAVDGALQVVMVGPGLLPALSAGFSDPLDLREQLFVDEGWMLARVLDAFKGDDADVVAVLQDGVYL